MILIYLCEDSEADLLRLRHHLDAYENEKQLEFEVREFSSGDDLLTAFKEAAKKPLLMLLDIYMEGLDGMEVARRLRGMGYEGGIIFTTSSTEHAMDSYEVNALYYLQKPYDHTHFQSAMERCGPFLANIQQRFVFRKRRREIAVSYKDILFFETGQSHSIILHTTSQTFSFTGTLAQIAYSLRQSDCFFQIGRSFVVNLDQISGWQQNDLLMSDGSIVQIPLRKHGEVFAMVQEWKAGR